ncbi:FkbM family methyltransferase [Williamsia serinedens]|uniref:Methyltransferase, FkbM family n=1 Tax=Williamsia serinedens TaxID=391736 RepID=A0ABT1H411_9NOCA|nr:FkbM family methyltransferase [Williamsia serinedens]MCP2161921.1 methyltransferase, FkbM family [Williamsia serinedens]
MTIAHRIRRGLRRTGFDLVRYPGVDATVLLTRLLTTAGVEAVVDIGANGGRYGQELRDAGWGGRITSFEPLSEPYARLQRASAGDAVWTAHQLGLGDADTTAEMTIASNAGESSSLLPMLEAHRRAAPQITPSGTERVAVRRLDSIADLLPPGDRHFVKVDTQGFEARVIEGGAQYLSTRCIGIQLELSLVPLYSEGMAMADGDSFARSQGMVPATFIPGFADLETGRLLQIDAVYFRPECL